MSIISILYNKENILNRSDTSEVFSNLFDGDGHKL